MVRVIGRDRKRHFLGGGPPIRTLKITADEARILFPQASTEKVARVAREKLLCLAVDVQEPPFTADREKSIGNAFDNLLGTDQQPAVLSAIRLLVSCG